MTKNKKINIGLIGFGTIGSGVYKILTESKDVIKDRLGTELVLKRVADKDITTDRGIGEDKSLLTSDANDILNDPEIDIVIELVGGTGIAKDFVMTAIANGKHVVTANKALISAHGKEIFEASVAKNVDIGFEASVAGGIPVIKALREGLSANRIDSIYGIINGTANYILTKMTNEGSDFGDVLKAAQEKGYAEADPTFDIEGNDTAHKLAILINLAYGTYKTDADIFTEGISSITGLDLKLAGEFGYVVKLLAIAKAHPDGQIEARVHPTMLPKDHPLAKVDGVYNAVYIEGDAVGPTMHYGMGAGMMPTASAVIADVMDIARDIVSDSIGRVTPLGHAKEAIKDIAIRPMDETRVPYYMRFLVKDAPGVLSKITGILGEHNISISLVTQKGLAESESAGVSVGVSLVIVTHQAKEWEMCEALEKIEALDSTIAKGMIIRIEESL
jgi:homoserine dehydrogenase